MVAGLNLQGGCLDLSRGCLDLECGVRPPVAVRCWCPGESIPATMRAYWTAWNPFPTVVSGSITLTHREYETNTGVVWDLWYGEGDSPDPNCTGGSPNPLPTGRMNVMFGCTQAPAAEDHAFGFGFRELTGGETPFDNASAGWPGWSWLAYCDPFRIEYRPDFSGQVGPGNCNGGTGPPTVLTWDILP